MDLSERAYVLLTSILYDIDCMMFCLHLTSLLCILYYIMLSVISFGPDWWHPEGDVPPENSHHVFDCLLSDLPRKPLDR